MAWFPSILWLNNIPLCVCVCVCMCVCVCVYLKKTLGCSRLKAQGHKLPFLKQRSFSFCQAACLKGPGQGWGSLPAAGLSACLSAQLSSNPLVISHLSSTFSFCYIKLRFIGWSEFSGWDLNFRVSAIVTVARFVKWKNGDMNVFVKEIFFLRYWAKHFENKVT